MAPATRVGRGGLPCRVVGFGSHSRTQCQDVWWAVFLRRVRVVGRLQLLPKAAVPIFSLCQPGRGCLQGRCVSRVSQREGRGVEQFCQGFHTRKYWGVWDLPGLRGPALQPGRHWAGPSRLSWRRPHPAAGGIASGTCGRPGTPHSWGDCAALGRAPQSRGPWSPVPGTWRRC